MHLKQYTRDTCDGMRGVQTLGPASPCSTDHAAKAHATLARLWCGLLATICRETLES